MCLAAMLIAEEACGTLLSCGSGSSLGPNDVDGMTTCVQTWPQVWPTNQTTSLFRYACIGRRPLVAGSPLALQVVASSCAGSVAGVLCTNNQVWFSASVRVMWSREAQGVGRACGGW